MARKPNEPRDKICSNTHNVNTPFPIVILVATSEDLDWNHSDLCEGESLVDLWHSRSNALEP